MTDLEITKLCAEAMAYRCTGGSCSEPAVRVEIPVELSGQGHYREFAFDPLHDDAQCMELFKKFISRCGKRETGYWWVEDHFGNAAGMHKDLNRAICECCARMQLAKAKP